MRKMPKPLALAASVLALAASMNAWASDFYQQRNLVSNTSTIHADNRDTKLVNAWGLAFNPYGVAWVADNGSGFATLYDGNGKPQSLVVTIPGAGGASGNPTGTVFYGGNAFMVSKGSASGPSRFLFASEDGGVAAWAPAADMTHAIRMIDNSASNAVYKGIAISGNGTGNLIYVSDFHNAKVDVYDSNFHPVTLPGKPFFDPNLPSGYAPFGIQAIHGDIYVSYAKQDSARHDDVAGAGFGYIDVYGTDGHLIRRFASNGPLNSPWGMTVAPASFGKFSNRLLVGNFGDGMINAYDLDSGHFVGRLKGANHQPIKIPGLWGLAFGNGLSQQPVSTLFFASGPNDESNGLYGRLDVAPGDQYDDSNESE